MKRKVTVIVALAGFFVAELPLSSCSLIGLAVDGSPAADTVSVDPALRGPEGKTVLITLRNGERFTARYVKVGSLPMELYRTRYLQWQKEAQSGTSPFTIGETLHVSWNKGQIAAGMLLGFTGSALVIERPGVVDGFLKHRPQALSIPIERVDSLRTLAGKVWAGEKLQGLLEQKSIPKMDALLVRRGEDAAWVSIDDVATVAEIRHSYTWFNFGAIVDGAGLIVAAVYLVTRR